MSERISDISDAARQLRDEMTEAGIPVRTMQNIEQFRRDLIEANTATVEQAVARFDGEIESVEINGQSCRQLTPSSWLEASDPVILYAYGGGYVSGSTFEDQMITLPLARAANARVIMVDYRLSPEHPYPAAQDDFAAVYPLLLETYGHSRLVISGESAGGNNAVHLLQRLRASGSLMPACAVLLSPWVDLSGQGDSHVFNDNRDPTLNNDWVDLAAAMHAPGHSLQDPGISPVYGEFDGLPPTMITTGSLDLLLSDCLRLAHGLRAAGVACDLRVWEGLWHVFEFYPIPEAETSIAEMAAFIRAHLS